MWQGYDIPDTMTFKCLICEKEELLAYKIILFPILKAFLD